MPVLFSRLLHSSPSQNAGTALETGNTPSANKSWNFRKPSAQQPFVELKLSDRQIRKKIDKLENKGYFTVLISNMAAHLQEQNKSDAQ